MTEQPSVAAVAAQSDPSSESIVVGTDGSQTADRAVEKACQLARALGTMLHVVMSYNPGTSGAWMAAAGGIATDPYASEREARKHAEEVLERARQRLNHLQVNVQTHLCSGDPADALITVAEDQAAQMIVVGNRGMTGARRVLGSVPNRVSHQAHCAVLIVPTR
jgi:nucleotide-binding universal stress UspA family protein